VQLADPDGHFPYKSDAARTALETPPEPGTNNHPEHWYASVGIIDATEAYVDAQKAYLEHPDDTGAQEAYRRAGGALVKARQMHRQGRAAAPVAVAGHPADIERSHTAMRHLAKQGFTADQIAAVTSRPLAEVLGALSGLED
jgi:hypothetical protein